jgi:hypothetical protein
MKDDLKGFDPTDFAVILHAKELQHGLLEAALYHLRLLPCASE